MDNGAIETLNNFNKFYPIKGSLYILREDEEYLRDDSMTEIHSHFYQAYNTSDWGTVTHSYDNFGFTWHNRTSRLTKNFENTGAILANEENHELDSASYRPIKEVIPDLYEEVDEDSDVLMDVYRFAKSEPDDFVT